MVHSEKHEHDEHSGRQADPHTQAQEHVMAKRGERLPWKVRFVWSSGIRGTVACHSEDVAQMKADAIRRAGEWRDDATVTVTVEKV